MSTEEALDAGKGPEELPSIEILLPDGWNEVELDGPDVEESIRALAEGLLDD